jgi:hypothetical protein
MDNEHGTDERDRGHRYDGGSFRARSLSNRYYIFLSHCPPLSVEG